MPAENNPQRLDSDEAQVQLDEGLRSVVAWREQESPTARAVNTA